MVTRLLAGEKARAIARSTGCSPTTVTTTRDRWLEANEAMSSGIGYSIQLTAPERSAAIRAAGSGSGFRISFSSFGAPAQ